MFFRKCNKQLRWGKEQKPEWSWKRQGVFNNPKDYYLAVTLPNNLTEILNSIKSKNCFVPTAREEPIFTNVCRAGNFRWRLQGCAVPSAVVWLGGHQVGKQPQSTWNATPAGLWRSAVSTGSF